ncbi:FAD binding domain-containing protein [Mycobacterium riyadhense]|uniref:Carbon monoxide dehydrogenase n=1 Tax=Mycobacterium riyadhense TaxID=486698 RepID=A0A1X2BXM6_9MYCO|nr:xanthine dehydrogenase family protein subunit M [Mycobacterium riyadhense]MCV7144757.1 xanthine dehydrogenase family protein subunit M [Mycobacterium riyadhense]ORW68362.1 carbon monoxide dehydrogenase [Mycobacterium riyadhense]VTP02992.1 6-hydroxypseudooxynicotine dehydrogenase complex subunit alpha [Mycobacterium riyadhense]
MKPASFDYHRPDTIEEAVGLLAELGEDAKILAGGQSLVPMLSMRLAFFDHLIDISRLGELQGIERRGDQLWIGAGTTEAKVGGNDQVREAVPLLTRVTPYIGHFQIRNRGTLGGSIAHADAAGEYPVVALTLDAMMEVLSPRGRREITASDFFAGLWETTMEPDEVLTGVRFPQWNSRSGFAVHEFARRHGDYAIAGSVVALELDDTERISRCAIGLLGLGATPKRAITAEAAVIGKFVGDLEPAEIGRAAMAGLDDIPTDLQGSAAYRARVGAAMTARAWTQAVNEATMGAIHA